MSGDNNRRAIVALDIVDLLLFTQYFKASFQLDTKKKENMSSKPKCSHFLIT
jgi:hypothetical protein